MINKNNINALFSFVNAVANGMEQYKAYIQFVAKKKTLKQSSARSRASQLMAKPLIKKMYEEAVAARKASITELIQVGAVARAKEFSEAVLTVDELDAFHSSIIQGKIEMIENITVYSWQELYDKEGNVIGRERKAGIMKATRPPNIREKQASVDALYRRKKAYPAVSPFGGSNTDDGEAEVIDYFITGDGQKHLLFPKQLKG